MLLAASFNLERIFELGFDNYAEFIEQLAVSAKQEMLIEAGLKKIEATWADLVLDIVPYRYDCYAHCISISYEQRITSCAINR